MAYYLCSYFSNRETEASGNVSSLPLSNLLQSQEAGKRVLMGSLSLHSVPSAPPGGDVPSPGVPGRESLILPSPLHSWRADITPAPAPPSTHPTPPGNPGQRSQGSGSLTWEPWGAG